MDINIFGILSFLSDLAPFFLLLFYFKILKNPLFTVLFIWTVVSLFFDIYVVYTDLVGQQEIAFYSIMVETGFVGIFYFIICKKRNFRIIIFISTILLLAFFIVELMKNKIEGFPYYLASIAVIYTLLLSLLTFADIYMHNKNEFLLNNSSLWLVFAYIIYAAGNLFLFATTDLVPNLYKEPGVWSIFFIANIFKNSFFVKTILQEKSNPSKY